MTDLSLLWDPCKAGLFWLSDPQDLTKEKAKRLSAILPHFYVEYHNLFNMCNKYTEYEDESIRHPALHRERKYLRDTCQELLYKCKEAVVAVTVEIQNAKNNVGLPGDAKSMYASYNIIVGEVNKK